MDCLTRWDLDENTLLIFMTDNGQAGLQARRHGQPWSVYTAGLRTGKGTPGEGGTRVPAFWRWPGVLPADMEIDVLTAHIDLFPTLASLANAELPAKQVEGRNLLPLLDNPESRWPDRYLFTHVGRWKKGADPNTAKFKNCAVRNSRFRLINNRELFDIQNDPGESSNVISRYPEVVRSMREAYDQWWDAVGPMMVNESVPNASQRPFHVEYQRQLAEQGIPEWQIPDFK